MYMHFFHPFMLPSIVAIVFSRWGIQYPAFSQENDSFSWLCLYTYLFERLHPAFFSSPVSPDLSSMAFFCHLLYLMQLPSLLLCEYVRQNYRLHCLFLVRTSGDIKGLLRGLSLCISPALTVCAQDSSIRFALRSITPRLKRWLVGNNMPAPAGCICTYSFAIVC